MDKAPRPPPPPPRTSPGGSPSNRKGLRPSSRPPLMQRNLTTGSVSPLKPEENLPPPVIGGRTRTYSANNARDIHSSGGSRGSGGMPPPRGMLYYRSASSARFREQNLDPLLMVSLERPDLEDEAETTLLDVLERRHVHFDANVYAAATPAHRRNRTFGGAIPDVNTFQSPTIDIRPNSAPDSTDVSRRPGMVSRSASYRSRRNNFDGSNLSDYLGVEGNGVSLSHEGNDRNLTQSASSDSSIPYQHSADTMQASGSPTRKQHQAPNWNFRRQQNLYGRRRTSSETADYSDGSSIRERAFQVAMAMRHESTNTFTSSEDEGDLSDLLNRVEAVRENEENSRGSRGSASKNTGGSRGRLSDSLTPRDNWSRSTKSREQDTNGSSGFSLARRHRLRETSHHKSNHQMFMGISTPLGGGFGGQSNVDMLFQAAEHVQELCQIPEGDEQEDNLTPKMSDSIRSHGGSTRSQVLASENANFLQQITDSHPEVPKLPDEIGDDLQEPNEQTPMLDKAQSRRQNLAMKVNQTVIQDSTHLRSGKLNTIYVWISNLRRQLKILWVALDLPFVREKLWDFIQYQLTCVIVPLLAIAAFFFYRLDNPTLPFLPNDTSVSWWILFVIRSYLTLILAYVTEYLVVDVLATRSPVSVQTFGPLFTLYVMNAKGGPFLLTFWGVWNFVLVHGNSDEHWFYSTDIEMLNPANRADGIVDSELYTDILLSMIVAGVATSVKRTILALYLGKRVYIHYKPKLEKVMFDMLLLTEVAELANALDEFEEGEKDTIPHTAISRHNSLQHLSNKSTMVEFVQSHQKTHPDTSEDEGDHYEDLDRPEPIQSWNRMRSLSNEENVNVTSVDEVLASAKKQSDMTKRSVESDLSEKGSELCGIGIADEENESGAQVHDDFVGESAGAAGGGLHQEHNYESPDQAAFQFDEEPPVAAVNEPVHGILHQASTTSQIRNHLDRWQEPVNKLDKTSDPTIHEILQFRKALAFLDDEQPFGASFGPAFNRDSCINSSRTLYRRLLAFEPSSPVLNFDVIGVLAYEADGNFDEKKAKGLVRLFRPDRFDEVTLLAFVQSCDGVFKRLRYLRASVGNSTSIDRVLESIFNTIYNFFLFLTVLSIMKLNPWALLVSLSTVLVSFAFALGPTAAKFIEGMVMIAVRRPFDLGDRISISNPSDKSSDNDPGYDEMWLVEDCNLFTTTLRFARTNEISYLNNGMLSNCKIVNHGRSVNAVVNILVNIRLEATHEQIQLVKSSLEQFIGDNPRVWASMVFWRIAKVDPNLGLIAYSLRVQHVKSWQDHASVMRDRGELFKFSCEILMRLGIEYQSPATMSELFVKELPPSSPFVSDCLAAHE